MASGPRRPRRVAHRLIIHYGQKESDRLGPGLRFTALAPRMMPDTDLGKHAVAGYCRYLGISEADFIRSTDAPPTSSDVATAVIEVAADHVARVFSPTSKNVPHDAIQCLEVAE